MSNSLLPLRIAALHEKRSCWNCSGCKTVHGKPCEECGGAGQIEVPPMLAPTTQRCWHCRGTGVAKRITEPEAGEGPCVMCKGSGQVPVSSVWIAPDDENLRICARRIFKRSEANGYEVTESECQAALFHLICRVVDDLLDPADALDAVEHWRWDDMLAQAHREARARKLEEAPRHDFRPVFVNAEFMGEECSRCKAYSDTSQEVQDV